MLLVSAIHWMDDVDKFTFYRGFPTTVMYGSMVQSPPLVESGGQEHQGIPPK